MHVVHGKKSFGQIYIPAVNYTLMVACIVLVAVLRDGAALTAAYGVSVAGSFVCTAIVYTIYLAR